VDDEAAVQIGVPDGPGGVRDQRAERQCQMVIADKFLAAKIEFRHVDNYRLFRVARQWRRGASLNSGSRLRRLRTGRVHGHIRRWRR
jgi:hypothetical protein